MKVNIKIIYIVIFEVLFSCKDQKSNISSVSNISIEDLKQKISVELEIKKVDTVNIDDDSDLEYIITTTNKKKSNIQEFWFKKDKIVTSLKYPFYDINYKWLVNVDDDKMKEVIRAQGFEDGINYVVNDVQKNEEVPLLYFNPALIDVKYPNKIFWAYPWDIKEPIVNKNKFKISLNNKYERDGQYINPDNQKELPFIFFKGQTTQPEAQVNNLNTQQDIFFFELLEKVKSQVDIKQTKEKLSIIKQTIQDINKDGIEDKIEIYKNENISDNFNKEHFKLPVRIYKGTNSGEFELWAENNKIVYNLNNNCVSEGFNNIKVKKEYFTIEAQTCYDYNILVNGYITFKVIDDEIYLYKYGEEYFDKAEHEKKIPSKTWSTKDFGKIKFENVTESLLFDLRKNEPKK